jgi:transposase
MTRQNPRTFTAEFRQMAIDLALHGEHTVAQIERDLGLSSGLLRRWLKKHRMAQAAGTTVAAVTTETQEMARLRREVKRLEQENLILKKAVAIFAHPSSSGISSSLTTER